MPNQPIDWEKVARTTLPPLKLQVLEVYAEIGAPLSPSDAARELGADLKAVAYQVGALAKQGLLKLVGEERRRGRTASLYSLAAVAGEGE